MASLAITECIEKVSDEVQNTRVGTIVESLDKRAQAMVSPSQKEKKGQVVQRSYTLNDTGALKKKIRHESRKELVDERSCSLSERLLQGSGS